MLNSISHIKIMPRMLSLVFALFTLLLSSCMPQQTAPTINTSNSTDGDSPRSIIFPDPNFSIDGIFVQEGATQTKTNFSLPINFSDSFLIRGKEISQYLRTIPNTTRFCLVNKYTNVPGSDRYLLLTAKPKSFTDLVNKTTEFYFHVEPGNDIANQNDCLKPDLTSALSAESIALNKSSSFFFSLLQLCQFCSTTVTSDGLRLTLNGNQVANLNLTQLRMSIIKSTSTDSGLSCVESSACMSRGYNCCLDSQCVTDGAVRPNAILDPAFSAVQAEVATAPNRFVLYPQYYFVCASRPEEGYSSGNDQIDPVYEASVRMMELNNLYQCLNKVDGEISYCTVKFTQASQKINAGNNFSAAELGFRDDINFSRVNSNFSVTPYSHNIIRVFYGGQTLYDHVTKPTFADGSFHTAGNDNLSSAQTIKVLPSAIKSNLLDDNLYITYKVDGSCQKINSSLARCSKTFIHNSSPTTAITYHDNSPYYSLPDYADMSGNIIVKVSGLVVPEDATTWTRQSGLKRLDFSNYTLYQNQTVEIIYYVSSSINELVKSKESAQATVNSMCLCGSTNCNLKPLLNEKNEVINYECIHPSPASTEPPANQTIYVSSKNVPHRFYDVNGVSYDDDYSQASAQEGKLFGYKNGDVLKPSNLDEYEGYTGFNEIHGSFVKNNALAARPAKLVRVKKDKIYDIFTNSGVFSSCLSCGSDYYSALQRIFPQNFTGIGGGYSPNNLETRRENSSSLYRSDDLLFGRACFVPAAMIPWTHREASSVRDQRRTRLAGQHFLFANGYNRDWYGFDYGSLIGSFDGVTWFSIGNQRRIKASTSKLFLAINSYYGDLNTDGNFNVTVSEITAFSSPDIPDHDTKSDGAECQKSHFCSSDNDCFRQLGYDYTCQNVTGLTTSWPVSDANGNEMIGSQTKTLASIVGGSNGQNRRCVYRGRGAPCHQNLGAISSTFNSSSLIGNLACSSNNVCQLFSSGARFNDRISRFASTPTAQNIANASPTPSDTVGLGARIIGRPFDFYGNRSLPGSSSTMETAAASFAANGLNAICVPGKNITSATGTFALNSLLPSSNINSADKILGIGSTLSGTTANNKYYNACPATQNGVILQHSSTSMTDANLTLRAINQNLSTNLLDNLTATLSESIFSSTNGSQITSIGYQRNACLRAAGSSCFSDMDCAPSSFIASKVKPLTITGINAAEKRFWEEDLVCGNPELKYLNHGQVNPLFDLKKNTCCREIGKVLTVDTQITGSTHRWCDVTAATVAVAGFNQGLTDSRRYSRVHTAYDNLTCNASELPGKNFALSLVAGTTTARFNQLTGQFKTLDLVNGRTCCSTHWVRHFSKTNGDDHRWTQSKQQVIEKSVFSELNWTQNLLPSAQNSSPYSCEPGFQDLATCEVRNFNQGEIDRYLKFFGSLELTGIPQVPIMTQAQVFKLNNGTDQGWVAGGQPITGTISPATADFNDGTINYYSATNVSATANLKKVFSENEFSCCLPAGKEVPSTTTREQCCTGFIADQGVSTLRRCCLPDFTDLTLYLNRYVSSEGRGLPDSAYDPATGYIKDPGLVMHVAGQKGLCCSGQMRTGVAIWRLPIPINGDGYIEQESALTKRFVQFSSAVDNNSYVGPIGSVFDAGVRWNDHVYCIPAQGFPDLQEK
jgi:hypothetical protein